MKSTSRKAAEIMHFEAYDESGQASSGPPRIVARKRISKEEEAHPEGSSFTHAGARSIDRLRIPF